MAKELDQEFVEYVVGKMVTKPEAVKVVRTIDERGVFLQLTVDKEDMGVVIGKEGRTAKAIRTLLRVLGAKNDARVSLDITEPDGERRERKEDKKEEPKEEAAAEEVVEEEEEKETEEEEEKEDDDPLADLDL